MAGFLNCRFKGPKQWSRFSLPRCFFLLNHLSRSYWAGGVLSRLYPTPSHTAKQKSVEREKPPHEERENKKCHINPNPTAPCKARTLVTIGETHEQINLTKLLLIEKKNNKFKIYFNIFFVIFRVVETNRKCIKIWTNIKNI